MNINTQKLLAGYTSIILGINTILFSIIYVLITFYFNYQTQETYGIFIFEIVLTAVTFYCAFIGYKNLKSLSLRKNAMFIIILNFLFFIQIILDYWLINIFGNYHSNLSLMILELIITIVFGLALLRNGTNLLKISKIPPIKKIRNVSLWLLFVGIISLILMLVVIAVDISNNPNKTLYVENPEADYEFGFSFLDYLSYFFTFLFFVAFGIGSLGIIYWVYLKIKK